MSETLFIPAVVRSIDGIPSKTLNQIQIDYNNLAIKEGFNKPERRRMKINKFAGRISLVRAGHLEHFLRANDLSITQGDAYDLAEHIYNQHSHELSSSIDAPALPTKIDIISDEVRALVLGSNESLRSGEPAVKTLVEDFFGVDPSPNSWPKIQVPAGCELATTRGPYSDDLIDLVQTATESQRLLTRATLTYSPLSIEMVEASDPATMAQS